MKSTGRLLPRLCVHERKLRANIARPNQPRSAGPVIPGAVGTADRARSCPHRTRTPEWPASAMRPGCMQLPEESLRAASATGAIASVSRCSALAASRRRSKLQREAAEQETSRWAGQRRTRPNRSDHRRMHSIVRGPPCLPALHASRFVRWAPGPPRCSSERCSNCWEQGAGLPRRASSACCAVSAPGTASAPHRNLARPLPGPGPAGEQSPDPLLAIKTSATTPAATAR